MVRRMGVGWGGFWSGKGGKVWGLAFLLEVVRMVGRWDDDRGGGAVFGEEMRKVLLLGAAQYFSFGLFLSVRSSMLL